MFFKIALLNILKHMKRSVVVFLAVLIAVFMMSMVSGLIRGLTESFRTGLLPNAGHLQIKAEGSKDAANPLDLKLLIPNADEVMGKLQDPAVINKEKILNFGALILDNAAALDPTKDVKNLRMMGQGIEAQTKYFRDVRGSISEGTFLTGDPKEILLSRKIVDLMKYKLHEEITLLTADKDNNPWSQVFTLVGVFQTGNDLVDENQFFINHQAAETLLNVAGSTREIRVSLDDPDKAEAVRNKLTPVIREAHAETQTWEEVFGSILLIVKFIDIINVAINFFFVIVAASVITNSILMTVFERIREYGTLRAIGLKRRQVFALILTESSLLGLVGAVAGLLVSLPALWYFHTNGLDIGGATNYLGMGDKLFAVIQPAGLIMAFVAGILIAVVAGLYAARASSKLSVTESLSHN